MIENRRGLTIFSHTMLILGIIVILFPLYVAFGRHAGHQSGV
jgi:sn-glycerol 3-phosphate transport system permease protein